MIDPRTSIIKDRITKIKHIIAVSSGKGGVGKSVVSTVLALALSRENYKVGLFDLDFTGPSTHTILGISTDLQPREEKGIVPPIVDGLEYMSLVYYVGENPLPLRGGDVSNALIELLSVTQWGSLDYLVIDMPPGIGDAVLDLVRFVKPIEFLIVTTPSLLAFDVVKKQIAFLCELEVTLLGVVENMKIDHSTAIKLETIKLGLNYLEAIPFDSNVEEAIGNPNKLLDTAVGNAMPKIIRSLLGKKVSQNGLQSGNF